MKKIETARAVKFSEFSKTQWFLKDHLPPPLLPDGQIKFLGNIFKEIQTTELRDDIFVSVS